MRTAHHPIWRATPVVLALLLGGCRGCISTRPPIHLNPNMDDQPKLKAQAESTFFYDGSAMRTPVEGTVAQDELHEDTVAWTGKNADGSWADAVPGHDQPAVLARGEQRFGIYCNPCHGAAADGKGMLYQRAQVQSANLMEARFRAMPAGQIFDEVTHGQGLMPAYGPFVPASDRWAIIAYLRKLQAETPVPAGAEAAPAAQQAASPSAPPSLNSGLPGQPATPSAQTGAPPPPAPSAAPTPSKPGGGR